MVTPSVGELVACRLAARLQTGHGLGCLVACGAGQVAVRNAELPRPLALLFFAGRCLLARERAPLAVARRHSPLCGPRTGRSVGHSMAGDGLSDLRAFLSFKTVNRPARPMDTPSAGDCVFRHLPAPTRAELRLLARILPSPALARHPQIHASRLAGIRLVTGSSGALELHARELRPRLDHGLRVVWPTRLGRLPSAATSRRGFKKNPGSSPKKKHHYFGDRRHEIDDPVARRSAFRGPLRGGDADLPAPYFRWAARCDAFSRAPLPAPIRGFC